jgi:hypothetical protein
MEELRNYIQHRNLPVRRISIGCVRAGAGIEDPMVWTAKPGLDTAAIREDGKFKASVLAELEAAADTLSLKCLARDYLSGLGRVHGRVLAIVQPNLPAWEACLAAMRHDCEVAIGAPARGLEILARTDEAVVESEQIFDDFIERRRWLEKKNARVPYLMGHIVSSE